MFGQMWLPALTKLKEITEIKANKLAISRAYQDKTNLRLPASTSLDTEITQLYHDTYLEWENETKNDTFASSLRDKLLAQFKRTEEYSFSRFTQMTDEVLRG